MWLFKKLKSMSIERTDSELIFKIPSNMDALEIQKIIDFFRYKEATARSKANQEEVDQIAEESKSSWWKENKSKYIK